MDTRNLRPESHVAQQSRRDKLRVVHHSHLDHQQHYLQSNNNLDYQGRLNPDLFHDAAAAAAAVRNGSLIYDPAVFSSEIMMNFERDAMVGQETSPVASKFNSSAGAGTSTNDTQRGGTWGGLEPPQSYDWMVNYASGSSAGGERNARLSFNEYQDVPIQSAIATSASAGGDIYQNTIQDVGSTSVRYGNQSSGVLFDNANAWMSRPVENCYQWSGELGLIAKKSEQHGFRSVGVAGDHANSSTTHQGLSLSLSSSSSPKVTVSQFGEGYESEYWQSKLLVPKESAQDCKLGGATYSYVRPSIVSKGRGKSVQDTMVTSTPQVVLRDTTGPLGPFTGYATILKTSRFLKPAQELLDEFCSLTCPKLKRTSEGEFSPPASTDAFNAADTETAAANCNNNSGVSSSTFYSSNEGSDGDGGIGSSTCEAFGPEYQQKKAKLLYLQEEVCRKYKQYHQQMQMVASSFESVAGLSSATPYLSLAIKTVSRNFRSLKHIISNQLKHVTKTLGEDLFSPSTVASSSKGDTITSRLRYMDQSFQKFKSNGANVGYLEPQQPIWRPQRGLPERSVAILRAWLFDHFLHPYPTDTDKHMLATQTGLSRNQVSNWFINARVRIWKPMVEEIHMLETKSMAETNQKTGKNGGNAAEGTSQANADQFPNKTGMNSTSNSQLQCAGMGSLLGSREQVDAGQGSQEKRSRVEFQIPANMDGSLANFMPYGRSRIHSMGLGAVSLTLGLRHGVDNARQQEQQQQQQHQQQLQEQEDQFRRQFGGQIVHDFVG